MRKVIDVALVVIIANFFIECILTETYSVSTSILRQNEFNENLMSNNFSDSEPLISEGLQGAIIGGILGFVFSILVDRIKNWLDRPQLVVIQQTYQSNFEYPLLSNAEFMTMSFQFTGTRIKIKNKGNTAAENCKGTLIGDSDEFRIAWMHPKEDTTVTINAHDTEFIDICAIGKIKDHWKRIFTTERGYGKSQDEGRNLEGWSQKGIIRAQLKVSCKNAKPCIVDVIVLQTPEEDGKLVRLPNAVEDC